MRVIKPANLPGLSILGLWKLLSWRCSVQIAQLTCDLRRTCHLTYHLKFMLCRCSVIAQATWSYNTELTTIKISWRYFKFLMSTPGRRQSKTLSTIDERGSKIDRNSVFDCFLSPVWRQKAIENNTGDKRQSKTLFLTIFDLRSSIALAFSIATYPV